MVGSQLLIIRTLCILNGRLGREVLRQCGRHCRTESHGLKCSSGGFWLGCTPGGSGALKVMLGLLGYLIVRFLKITDITI